MRPQASPSTLLFRKGRTESTKTGGGLRNAGTLDAGRPIVLERNYRCAALMPPSEQRVRAVVDTYIRAWVQQDPDLITTIFTHSATYHERIFEEPIRNREGIRDYWQSKVVQTQAHITCELLNLYLDGDTAIAERQAEFDDVPQGIRKRMREVAILVFEDHLIASLREYWATHLLVESGSSGQQAG